MNSSGFSGLGAFANTVREDASGRLWRVRSVDWAVVRHAIEAYDESLRDTYGDASVDADARAFSYIPNDPQPLDEYSGSFFSWTAHSVDGWRIWNTDNRVEHFPSPSSIQKKVLLYMLGDATPAPNEDPNATVCTATMIDNLNHGQFAATAAHCVQEDPGVWTNPRGFVCVNGNQDGGMQCARVIARYTNGWEGNRSLDYALLELDNSVNLSVGYMALSSASNATIQAATAWGSGYPAFLPVIDAATTLATVNWGTPDFGGGIFCDPNASAVTLDPDCWMQGYESSGSTRYTSSSLIGTTLDMASG